MGDWKYSAPSGISKQLWNHPRVPGEWHLGCPPVLTSASAAYLQNTSPSLVSLPKKIFSKPVFFLHRMPI